MGENGLENGAVNNKLSSMTTTLDKAGRVMLPVKIREKLKLKAGMVFKVEIVGDKIELEQAVPKFQIV